VRGMLTALDIQCAGVCIDLGRELRFWRASYARRDGPPSSAAAAAKQQTLMIPAHCPSSSQGPAAVAQRPHHPSSPHMSSGTRWQLAGTAAVAAVGTVCFRRFDGSAWDAINMIYVSAAFLALRMVLEQLVIPPLRRALAARAPPGTDANTAAPVVFDQAYQALAMAALVSWGWVVMVRDEPECTPWHIQGCLAGWPHHAAPTLNFCLYWLAYASWYVHEMVGTAMGVGTILRKEMVIHHLVTLALMAWSYWSGHHRNGERAHVQARPRGGCQARQPQTQPACRLHRTGAAAMAAMAAGASPAWRTDPAETAARHRSLGPPARCAAHSRTPAPAPAGLMSTNLFDVSNPLLLTAKAMNATGLPELKTLKATVFKAFAVTFFVSSAADQAGPSLAAAGVHVAASGVEWSAVRLPGHRLLHWQAARETPALPVPAQVVRVALPPFLVCWPTWVHPHASSVPPLGYWGINFLVTFVYGLQLMWFERIVKIALGKDGAAAGESCLQQLRRLPGLCARPRQCWGRLLAALWFLPKLSPCDIPPAGAAGGKKSKRQEGQQAAVEAVVVLAKSSSKASPVAKLAPAAAAAEGGLSPLAATTPGGPVVTAEIRIRKLMPKADKAAGAQQLRTKLSRAEAPFYVTYPHVMSACYRTGGSYGRNVLALFEWHAGKWWHASSRNSGLRACASPHATRA